MQKLSHFHKSKISWEVVFPERSMQMIQHKYFQYCSLMKKQRVENLSSVPHIASDNTALCVLKQAFSSVS